MPLYVPLHLRSAYSLGRGTAPVSDLVAQAAHYGHDALALTDRNNLYGAVPFIRACREAGIRPILGAELDGPEGLVTLLARDETGYSALCRLITRRMRDPSFRLLPALTELHRGLHVLVDDAVLLARLARVVPRDALWGELAAPHHGHPSFGAIADASRDLGLHTVPPGAVTCLAREDHRLHATLTAVRKNTLVARLGTEDLASREAYLKAPAAMASVFRRHRDALGNARRIADDCRYVPDRTRWIFPDPPLPAGETAASHLRRLCDAGLGRRYPGRASQARRRLERELAVINRLGFSSYFVVVGEVMRFARSRGIPSVGRGSGASAVTSYVLGITNVDPVRYGLHFERFLHEKRPDWPDLDIDLCWKRRDEVIEHVYDTYGRDRVAMISTHTTFQPRSAFRETAKAHGVANRTVNRLGRVVPRSAEVPLRQALAASARGDEIPRDEPPWPRVLADAERLVGLPRHLGLHPGGIVISDRPLDHYVPLEDASKGVVCTQFEMHAIEAVGLVKIDLLGNRAVSTIQETVELVDARRGVRLEPDAFAHDDPATARLMSTGDTLGVFQMESPGMRGLNRMLATRDLATTVAAVALIRPGPAGSGMKERFCLRARGDEPVTYADPRLEPVLRDTFGVPLYEEDVMCVAAEVTGLSREDGDLLRRSIAGAGRREPERLARVFLARARRRGYDPAVARKIWDGLFQFGAFAFCKAHAAGYGVLAWQTGWLKAHYPVEFTAALMNHHAGMYDKRTHLEDAKRRGVRVLRPDVNLSADGFTAEDDAVRVGLSWVRGLSDATRRAALAARAPRPFAGLEDFLVRVTARRSEAEALILAGAFDFTGRTRPELLCVTASGFDLFRRRRGERGDAGVAGNDDLFTDAVGVRAPWTVPSLPEFAPPERMWLEWHVLGICVDHHPMHFLREAVPGKTVPAGEAELRVGSRVRVAGLAAARRTVDTQKGDLMQFVTLEDETGLIECTLFPSVYARHRGVVRNLGPYLAEGRVEAQHGAPTLNVSRLTRLPLPGALAGPVRDAVSALDLEVPLSVS